MNFIYVKQGKTHIDGSYKEIFVILLDNGYEKTEKITRYIPRCERFPRSFSRKIIHKKERYVPYGFAHNKCKKTTRGNIESVLISEGYEKLTIDEWWEREVDRWHMWALNDSTFFRRI